MKIYLFLFMTFFVCQQSRAEQIVDFSELSCITEHGEYICLGKDLKPYTGIVHRRYLDGTLRSINNYKDGKEDGLQKEYNKEGYLISESISKNGNWFEYRGYNKKGNIITESYWPEGVLISFGKYIDYYDNGKIKRIKDYDNNISIAYDEDGNPKNGILEFYGKDDEVDEIKNYKDGKEDGLQKSYYSSNRIYEEYTAKDGEYDGIKTDFNLDGTIIRKCLYEQGIKKWCKTREELENGM